ncbi:MAG: NADH-quinone oxidoreductase subunit C [Desulfobacteraceae bacterium]|nr:NADH-quinone oxidoreductase subunit C [Desulfobacteraceae bacterium]MBC2756102.1 NADH-quinone oxidoreductase subunit C [Desulfobacteraceae bacterium]MBC2763741.1 NADH-quinone oxidoreductase subunit C [ANME-2 cluster archaeon]
MLEEVIPVTPEILSGETAKIKYEGYKFITLSCVEMDANNVEILYHFDRDLQLKHFRLAVPKKTIIPSISPIYMAAFLVENEIQDLFAIRFSGLVIDFNRTLYLEDEIKNTPFCKYTVVESDSREISSPPDFDE